MADKFYATGRRKESVARAYLTPGGGNITVNRIPADTYFKRETLLMLIKQPFDITTTLGKYDVAANVKGGGLSGQAGALRHAIAKALVVANAQLRSVLRRNGFLSRDSRMKERKKYGQKGARKRFQFSKR